MDPISDRKSSQARIKNDASYPSFLLTAGDNKKRRTRYLAQNCAKYSNAHI